MLQDESQVAIKDGDNAELLLFDLPRS